MAVWTVILQGLSASPVEVISKHRFLGSAMRTPLTSAISMDQLTNASTANQPTNLKPMSARKITPGALLVDLMAHALNVGFPNC